MCYSLELAITYLNFNISMQAYYSYIIMTEIGQDSLLLRIRRICIPHFLRHPNILQCNEGLCLFLIRFFIGFSFQLKGNVKNLAMGDCGKAALDRKPELTLTPAKQTDSYR